jgi:hypothetical protein
MSKEAKIVNLEQPDSHCKIKQLQLDSRRRLLVHSTAEEEVLEIVESKGEAVMTIRLTEAGPVVTVRGAHLEMKATQTLTLEARKVKINAREEAAVESKGPIRIDSSKKLDIRSDDDICVVGKMIHLN